MNQPMQWRRNPKPDASVVKLAEAVSKATLDGQIRLIAVVTVNPMLEIEFEFAGDLDDIKKTLLIGGLQRLILKINE